MPIFRSGRVRRPRWTASFINSPTPLWSRLWNGSPGRQANARNVPPHNPAIACENQRSKP